VFAAHRQALEALDFENEAKLLNWLARIFNLAPGPREDTAELKWRWAERLDRIVEAQAAARSAPAIALLPVKDKPPLLISPPNYRREIVRPP